NGTAPYSYSIDGTTFQTSGTFTALPAGSYTFTLKDANGCTVTQNVSITQPSQLKGNITAVNTSCKNTSDGKIIVEVTGGTLPYSYVWNNDPTLNTNTLEKIVSGTYQITVTDALGCFIKLEGIVYGTNCIPLPVDDVFTGTEDIPVSGSVGLNDLDSDGDPLTYTIITQPANGTIIFNTDGSFIFTPASGWNGSTSFEYEVCDPQGLCTKATATITIVPVNHPPIAIDDRFTIPQGETLNERVYVNDSDPDNDMLAFTQVTQPKYGKLTFNSDGTFVYVPNSDYNGNDEFIYTACDPSGACDEAKVTLSIRPFVVVNLTPAFQKVAEGNKVSVTAVLTMPLNVDFEITLGYSGDALEGKDYKLFEQYVTLKFPAGKTTATGFIVIGSLIDNVKEKEEHVLISITGVNSTEVRIGTGADVTILDVYPPAKEISGTDENPAIKPDPLFSPNGDGQGNDYFVIKNITDFPDNEVIIFNRWGNEVYRVKGYDNANRSFAGSANTGILLNIHKDLPEGVYFYVIYTIDAEKIKRLNKGYLILKR
ncbi:MAG: tandem-95 repeat protein, partial [Flavobacterium sp.]|nr:tandem-95 repeat protein [Pedobacter sp.]